jgi:hypothetical protein
MSDDVNNPWLADRVRDVRAGISDLRSKVEPLEYLQLGWRPPEGGWSIAQVMEHLVITDQSYVDALRELLPKAKAATSSEWKPSFIGGFLIRSQMPDSKTKVTTPPRWRPGPEARANVVDEYIKLREQLIDLMKQADGNDLRRTKLSSPAAKWIRINVGDAFMTLVVHTQRHLRQIDRIRAHPQFPLNDLNGRERER